MYVYVYTNFYRIRPILDPLLQIAFHAQSQIGPLRCMEMRIYHSREKELASFEMDDFSIAEAIFGVALEKLVLACALDVAMLV